MGVIGFFGREGCLRLESGIICFRNYDFFLLIFLDIDSNVIWNYFGLRYLNSLIYYSLI